MKAKDLRGKDIEDIDQDSDEPKQEEDQVAAAYENISKKLDTIRSGGSVKDSDESDETEKPEEEEEDLEEWKGPKPAEAEEEEHELRKVKLHNLEDPKEKDEETKDSGDNEDDQEEEDDDEDDEKSDGDKKLKPDEEAEEPESRVKAKDWEPKENDPLDEEPEDLSPKEKEMEDDEEDLEETDTVHSDISAKADLSDSPEDLSPPEKSEPGTLDDLTSESSPLRQPADGRSEDRPAPREVPDGDEEDDYSIPNLKGSRQEGSNIGYNAPQQRESYGESYSPKSRYMDGNDPNNFFSQHNQTAQTPKRANKFHLLVLIIIGVAVIGFTVYVLKGGFGNIQLGSTPTPSPSATATPEPTPTPTPEPEIERGNFTVRVLNGTSTSGLAKTVNDKLKETGYKTASPGNASDSDVEQTEIRVKEGTQSATLFERLKLDLSPDYDAKEGEKLDEKAKYDAEVIIGAK